VLGTARTASKRMLPAILRSGQTIAAIAGRDPSKLAQFQRDFAIPAAHHDLNAVLQDSSVDAVYIPLPNSMHAEWTIRALEAGKRVLCEKPLALNLAEAERVIAAAREGVLLENFSYKTETRDSTLIPHLIEVHFSFQATEDHRHRYDPALGGGSFLDLGCYGVDFVHRLLDCDIEILDVQASLVGLVEETCLVRARSASVTSSGVAIEINSSFAQPPRQDFILHFANGEQLRIERADDMAGMLQAFANMTRTDAADVVRWRRNALVLEKVRSLIARQMPY
jgi:predicted dehydrogenase